MSEHILDFFKRRKRENRQAWLDHETAELEREEERAFDDRLFAAMDAKARESGAWRLTIEDYHWLLQYMAVHSSYAPLPLQLELASKRLYLFGLPVYMVPK